MNKYLKRVEDGEDAKVVILEMAEKIDELKRDKDQIFYSFQGYNKGECISWGHGALEIEAMEKEDSVVKKILEIAKGDNSSVEKVHILSLNRI